jgi:uncharacterized membrane-anchored protein YjiN (DUF445 family)
MSDMFWVLVNGTVVAAFVAILMYEASRALLGLV